MAFLTAADWQRYSDVINEFHEDANQEPIIWKKHVNTIDRYGEDKTITYTDIELKVLVQYNYFRSWPISKTNVSGQVDKESVMLYINTKYLMDNGYTNSDNLIDFDPGKDFFVIRGLVYRSFGETAVAQAKEKVLLQTIILKREEIDTGELKY